MTSTSIKSDTVNRMVSDNEADEKQPTAVLAFNDEKKSTSPAAVDSKSKEDDTKNKGQNI